MTKDLPTVGEMTTALSTQKNRNGYTAKIYKQQADEHRGELLAADLDRKIAAVRRLGRGNRVEWDNLPFIQARCLAYLEACRDAQSLPTVSGLSVLGIGATRQALNAYMRGHPNTDTTFFLQQIKDVFEDVIETAALMRNVDSVMSIFVLKNDHDRADRLQVEPVQTEPLGDQMEETELIARIRGSVPDDDLED